MPEAEVNEPSIAELRALLAVESPVAAEVDAEKQEVTEEAVAEVAAAESTEIEAESEPADKKQQIEEKDEPLPPHVAKRIRKEVDRQAEYDRQITEAVSNRKVSEARLAEVTKGSEPVKKTEATESNARPVRPDMDKWAAEFQEKNGRFGTASEWMAVLSDHHDKVESYLDAKYEAQVKIASKAIVEQELTARETATLERETEKARKAAWSQAETDHGKDEFRSAVSAVTKGADDNLQRVISGFDDWVGMTVRLGTNPDELSELVHAWKTDQVSAVRKLVMLEQSLKPSIAEPKVTLAAKRLPAPPRKVGGSATATAAVDLETADMATFKREYARLAS